MSKTKNIEEKKIKKQKIRHPIGMKLILLFAVLVIFALGITTFMVARLFTSDVGVRAMDNNLEMNSQTSNTIQGAFLNVQSDVNGLMNYLLLLPKEEGYELKVDALFSDLCYRNPEIQFIYTSSEGFRFARDFIASHPEAQEDFQDWLGKNLKTTQRVMEGSVEINNISSLYEDMYMYCISFSHENPVTGKNDFICVAFDPEIAQNNLIELCTGKTNNTLLLNREGDILISENDDEVRYGINVRGNKFIRTLMDSATSEGKQVVLKDEEGVSWICVCRVLVGNMITVTRIKESIVYESILHSTIRTLLVSLAVFFLTILIIRFFSKTLTNPIADLVEATNQIEAGDYDVKLKPRTKDEIGALTGSFINMTGGLKQRERLMSSFSKFTNHVIAEKAAAGELTMGGETKNATVFFSDIRSFTAMSEKMTPQEVVEFLNDYFTRMVYCVNKTNGIVDKFIGDAVMAVWGAATTNGSPKADAWAAVKAALMMRIALYHFNQNQIKNGKNPIKIGCGINSGPIVAGQIGSEDHMNYTVIGDTVNLASRTEALNKPFATDILITENTYKLVKDKIIVEEMPGVHVKGKVDAIKMYAVINAVGVKGPADVHKLREFLGWDEPEDISKVNTDEEEKKYKIGSK